MSSSQELLAMRIFPSKEEVDFILKKIREHLIRPQNVKDYDRQGLRSLLRTLEPAGIFKKALGNESLLARLERELGPLTMEEDYVVKSILMLKHCKSPGFARHEEVAVALEESAFEDVKQGLSVTFRTDCMSSDRGFKGFSEFIAALNDAVKLRKWARVDRYDRETLYIACSYRHASVGEEKFTEVGKTDLLRVVLHTVMEAGYKKFAVWTDRMLSIMKNKEGAHWYKVGLVPYLTMRTVYVCNLADSEKGVINDQNRMWLNLERSAAARGKGMVSYSRRMVTSELETHGYSFAMKHPYEFCDSWALSSEKWENWEERLQSLFFEMLTTSMLQRDTHFKRDVEQLEKLAASVLRNPYQVTEIKPLPSLLSRDGPVWHYGPWKGEAEWCFWCDLSPREDSRTLNDALRVLQGERAAILVEYIENGFRGGDFKKRVVILTSAKKHAAPALVVDCTDHTKIGRRAIIALPNSYDVVHTLIPTARMSGEKRRYMIQSFHGMLLDTGVLEIFDVIVELGTLEESNELLMRKVTNIR